MNDIEAEISRVEEELARIRAEQEPLNRAEIALLRQRDKLYEQAKGEAA